MVSLLLPIIYIAFISLGLPDSLLGSAWPTMYPELGVPVSCAGILSMIISLGTILSSLQSDRLTRTIGTGRVTAISVGMTAAALFGFSISTQFWMLCLWAIPYGLGAGSVDAALNNYVALHYRSRHMSWLHCMWGIGTMVSPMVMGAALTHGMHWTVGYRAIALFQVLLTVVLVVSLPLWKERRTESGTEETAPQALSLRQVFALPGAREVMLCFFCYCALETTAGLWSSSYLTLSRGVAAETAASFASLFYFGITAGRAACGFITMKFNDTQMIRLGQIILAVGVAALLIPGPVPLLPAGAAGAHGLHARAAGAQDPPQLIFCHSPFRIQQKAPCPVSRAGSLLFSGQLQDAAADGISHGKQVVLSNEAELCLVLIRKAYGQL